MALQDFSEPDLHEIAVAGARLDARICGRGETVVLVHGALSDRRTWRRQQDLLARTHRVVAYSQRYFGAAAWGDDWPPLGTATHADDLSELIARLDGGPVHLVAWSYGGHVALDVAVRCPQQVRSLFIYEPGVPTYVTDPQALASFGHDAQAMFGPIFEAVQAGDLALGVRRLIDGSGERAGYFEQQSPEQQGIEMDNARTLPLLLSQPAPPDIRPEDLAALRMPVAITWGECSRPVFGVVARAAACHAPGSWHHAVAGARHMWPDESPEAFVDVVRRWLDAQAGPGDETPR